MWCCRRNIDVNLVLISACTSTKGIPEQTKAHLAVLYDERYRSYLRSGQSWYDHVITTDRVHIPIKERCIIFDYTTLKSCADFIRLCPDSLYISNLLLSEEIENMPARHIWGEYDNFYSNSCLLYTSPSPRD